MSAKCSNELVYSRTVLVSPPALSVPTTQPKFTERQNTIHRPLPPPKILGQKDNVTRVTNNLLTREDATYCLDETILKMYLSERQKQTNQITQKCTFAAMQIWNGNCKRQDWPRCPVWMSSLPEAANLNLVELSHYFHKFELDINFNI